MQIGDMVTVIDIEKTMPGDDGQKTAIAAMDTVESVSSGKMVDRYITLSCGLMFDRETHRSLNVEGYTYLEGGVPKVIRYGLYINHAIFSLLWLSNEDLPIYIKYRNINIPELAKYCTHLTSDKVSVCDPEFNRTLENGISPESLSVIAGAGMIDYEDRHYVTSPNKRDTTSFLDKCLQSGSATLLRNKEGNAVVCFDLETHSFPRSTLTAKDIEDLEAAFKRLHQITLEKGVPVFTIDSLTALDKPVQS